MKSGFVAILGKPNAGKSSLLNTMIGNKVAIVTPKPQTTRNRIVGIYNDEETQIVFTDTPGIFRPSNKLGEYMMREVTEAAKDNDIILIVIDAVKGVSLDDLNLIEKYKNAKVLVALNKIDIAPREFVFPQLEKLNRTQADRVIAVSAATGENVDKLIGYIKEYLTDEIAYYPQDQYTDKSIKVQAAEFIREKAMIFLQQELPHGVAVDIERLEKTGDNLIEVDALIICEKENHKGIIIGKGGAMLKRISSSARIALEYLFGTKVYLTVYVKVVENWREKRSVLSDLGYK